MPRLGQGVWLALGAQAKAKDKYLLGWGKEAATYYQTMAISSAIKQGGDEVRLALENLTPDCWSMPAVQDVFTGMKKIVDAGYVKPGGAGTVFTAAQAQWSNSDDFILYPSGSWIENEMKTQTKDGFQMTGAPEPTVTSDSALRGRRCTRRPVRVTSSRPRARMWLVPLLWVILSSFKTSSEIFASPFSLPGQLSFENYRNAWTTAGIGSFFFNSVIVVFGALFAAVVITVVPVLIVYLVFQRQLQGSVSQGTSK